MTLLAPAVSCSSVAELVDANLRANVEALGCAAPAGGEGCEYLYGRDGSLTALQPDGAWYSGCSLPRVAGEAMLKGLKAGGQVGLFLAPPNAQAVAVALGKLERNQAVVAVVPDSGDLGVFLRCHDFSAEVRGHRLYFVHGADWAEGLAELLRQETGLPTPAYLIRVPATEGAANEMIPAAQRVIEAEARRREGLLAGIRAAGAAKQSDRFCVIAPRQFRLWANAGRALAEVFGGGSHVLVDPDDPAGASPLMVAAAARECGAVVAADLGRGDAPGMVAEEAPWVTWVTAPRVPAFVGGAGRDAIVLADPGWRGMALAAGWPAERVAVGAWPARPGRVGGEAGAAMIADTSVVPAAPETAYSSHRLLWEAIREELNENPLVAYTDVNGYLTERMGRMSIRAEGFDRGAFLGQLVVPVYQQALARLIVREGIPLKIWGAGWDRVEELRAHWAGAVADEEEFSGAVASGSVLVHPFPTPHVHAGDFAGAGNYRPSGRVVGAYLRGLRAALAAPPSGPEVPAISAELVRGLLDR